MRKVFKVVTKTLFFVCCGFISAISYATVSLGLYSGYLQQPTSNYYLQSRGAFGEFGAFDRKIVSHLSYLERPLFTGQGFSDHEAIGIACIGSEINLRTWAKLLATVGWGKVVGFVREESLAQGIVRRFSMEGGTLGMDLIVNWGWLELGVAHKVVIGVPNAVQMRSFVAWPYSLFLARLGMKMQW